MRALELAMALTAALAAGLLADNQFRTFGPYTVVISLLILVAHVLLDRPRFEAAPLCCSVSLASVLAISHYSVLQSTLPNIVFFLCLAGLLACYRYPVFSFPRPDGPFGIGTRTFRLVDQSRPKHDLDRAGGPRRIVAQVWYPAAVRGGERATYRDPAALPWRAIRLSRVRTNSYTEAPLLESDRNFPLVLYSPGIGGYRSQNTYLIEHLVSHGYVVAGVDHPDAGASAAGVSPSVGNRWLDFSSRAAFERSVLEVELLLKANVADLQFVLEWLLAGAGGAFGEIAKHFDLSRPAAIGFSFGGATAAELCRIDPRFTAGVNLDGWMFPGVTAHGVPKPFLFMSDDDPHFLQLWETIEDNPEGLQRHFANIFYLSILSSVERWGGYVSRLIGGTHENFSDNVLYRNPWFWNRPALDARAGHETVKHLVRAFLDQSVRGRTGALDKVRAQLGDRIDHTEYQTSVGQPVLSHLGAVCHGNHHE